MTSASECDGVRAVKCVSSPSSLQTIVSWIGSQANIFEKQKVREIASLIRDTDRHGKARIVDANEGEEPEEMLKVKNTHFEQETLEKGGKKTSI